MDNPGIPFRKTWLGLFVAGWVVLVSVPRLVNGDEPGRLSRLFRFGGSNTVSDRTTTAPPVLSASSDPRAQPSPMSGVVPAGPQPRIRPQPRASHAVTEADPIVTRISLARSDEGSQFGMFLQVYADGTVIDSQGVHRVGRAGIKEVVSVLESSDIHRVHGHCGAPSTDFVEHVQMVVYERSLGRLRATSFSCSGNPQGCDRSVRMLQTALETLQTKLGGTMTGPAPSAAAPPPVIGLTPVGPAPPQTPASPPPFDLGPVVAP